MPRSSTSRPRPPAPSAATGSSGSASTTPTPTSSSRVGDAFGLHELALEDAYSKHQRPKLEDYDGSYFVVLKTAHYDDGREEIDFGEINLFIGAGYLIAIRHGEGSALAPARDRLESRPELVEVGPAAAAWAILDKVVDDYEPVAAGIDNDITEVENEVFAERDVDADTADLLPAPRGDRVPPRRPAARRPARVAGERHRHRPRRPDPPLLPRRRRPCPADRRATPRPARPADRRPRRKPLADHPAPERGGPARSPPGRRSSRCRRSSPASTG